MGNVKKKPYAKRTDLEKLESNWAKTRGLLDRGEYSVSVVRAAVCLELAVTFAVRQELVDRAELAPEFVDHLLIWANGITGKFTKILMPVTKGSDRHKPIKAVFDKTITINKHRNEVAHGGHFKSKKTANEVVKNARAAIMDLVSVYQPGFVLEDVA